MCSTFTQEALVILECDSAIISGTRAVTDQNEIRAWHSFGPQQSLEGFFKRAISTSGSGVVHPGDFKLMMVTRISCHDIDRGLVSVRRNTPVALHGQIHPLAS